MLKKTPSFDALRARWGRLPAPLAALLMQEESRMNVLFCASEAAPFAASGGLGDVAGSLPRAIRNRKVACRVVMPLYGDMKQEYRDKLKISPTLTFP